MSSVEFKDNSAALGFDPDILETPEIDLYRFGFYGDNPPESVRQVLEILELE